MRWLDKMSENVKQKMQSWLQIMPANVHSFNIQETMDFQANVIKNRIWYLGDPDELSQLYSQIDSSQNRLRFWAARSSTGREIRKMHIGLPAIMVDMLTSIIMTDFDEVTVPDKRKDAWQQISRENKFKSLLEEAVSQTLYLGDGAFKISLDTRMSEYPIIEWYPADRIDIIYDRGRMKEVVFKTGYKEGNKQYELQEHYGFGYIRNELLYNGQKADLKNVSALAGLKDIRFDDSFCMAVPFYIYSNPRTKGRGKSIFDGKTDDFDSLDEVWSQWIQAMRDGRATKYIPQDLIPKNPETGALLKPNPFDNTFIATSGGMSENASDKIDVTQPDIPHESYLSTYITALDLCLQGIISPSTIGIDVKKLDNAEAQREKEKTTLYTRGKIIDALQTTIPELINTVFKSLDTLNQVTVEETETSVEFGDYANPSFESQIETVGKAKSSAIMSNEAVVDELYGDTKTEEWKQEEINRLNARDGVETMEEPALNMDGLEVEQGTNKEAGSTSTLNGAQITSLMGIIKMVKEGSVTRSEAISIVTATLGISKEAAESFIEGGMTGESKGKSKDVRNVPEGVSETP